jgi:hypothetical protein
VSSKIKSWQFPLTAAIVLLGTLVGGWLHGRTSTRWGADELMSAAGKELQEPLSDQLGNWRLVGETVFSSDVIRMLQCSSHVSRSYMHQQTGDVVSLFVIVGPPGPTSVHKPEICYGSQDFEITTDRTPAKITDREHREHTFWQVSMEPRNAGRTPQRVLYAWGTGASWSATNDPRFAHAGEPYLYKLQLAGPPITREGEFDPVDDFLGWFLPEIQTRLVATHQKWSEES